MFSLLIIKSLKPKFFCMVLGLLKLAHHELPRMPTNYRNSQKQGH